MLIGSQTERSATRKAGCHSGKKNVSNLYKQANTGDVKISFDAACSKEGNININLNARSRNKRTLQVFIHCSARYYTGVPGEELAFFKDQLVVQPNMGMCVYLPISLRKPIVFSMTERYSICILGLLNVAF